MVIVSVSVAVPCAVSVTVKVTLHDPVLPVCVKVTTPALMLTSPGHADPLTAKVMAL